MNSTALATVLEAPADKPVQAVATLLSPEQAANYLLLSISTLARMRIAGNGPTFIRLSKQRVGYRVSDLNKFLDGRTRTSTSQN